MSKLGSTGKFVTLITAGIRCAAVGKHTKQIQFEKFEMNNEKLLHFFQDFNKTLFNEGAHRKALDALINFVYLSATQLFSPEVTFSAERTINSAVQVPRQFSAQ